MIGYYIFKTSIINCLLMSRFATFKKRLILYLKQKKKKAVIRVFKIIYELLTILVII